MVFVFLVVYFRLLTTSNTCDYRRQTYDFGFYATANIHELYTLENNDFLMMRVIAIIAILNLKLIYAMLQF